MKFAWFIVFLCIIAGCDREREERPVRIAVSLGGTDVLTETKHTQGMTEAAENAKVDITWRTAHGDYALQKRQIDTLLAKDHDIIVVEVVDPRKADEIFGRIKRSGLPVIGFNRLAPGFQYDLIVSPDYRTIGRELAEIIGERYGNGKKNVLLLHGLLFNDRESIFIEGFLDALEQFDDFTVTKFEAVHLDNGSTGRIEVPGFKNAAVLHNIDIAIATNSFLTRFVGMGIKLMDAEGTEHRTPFIVGFDEKDLFTFLNIEYNNLLVIDRLTYDAGIQLINAAYDYARGEFRHPDGSVIRIGDHMIPVMYTPHKFVFTDEEK